MTTYGDWQHYINSSNQMKRYYCQSCQTNTAVLLYRYVTDGSGETHKEYQITCEKCQKAGSLHYSKNLAEHGWNAVNTVGANPS